MPVKKNKAFFWNFMFLLAFPLKWFISIWLFFQVKINSLSILDCHHCQMELLSPDTELISNSSLPESGMGKSLPESAGPLLASAQNNPPAKVAHSGMVYSALPYFKHSSHTTKKNPIDNFFSKRKLGIGLQLNNKNNPHLLSFYYVGTMLSAYPTLLFHYLWSWYEMSCPTDRNTVSKVKPFA